MNIVTPYPAINLNTANVHTESARRDNQLREVIPAPTATKPSNAENKTLNDGEKARQPGTDAGTYDAKGRLDDNTVVQERQQGDSEQSEQEQQETKQEQKKEQQVAEQEQQDQAACKTQARAVSKRTHCEA